MAAPEQRWRWGVGMVYVVGVALIWVVASFVVQSVVGSGVSPFLLTYICNSLFLLYLPMVEIARLCQSAPPPPTPARPTSPRPCPQSSAAPSQEAGLLAGGFPGDSSPAAAAGAEEGQCLLLQGGAVGRESGGCAGGAPAEGRNGAGAGGGEERRREWGRREVAWVSLLACPLWFLAQFTFNLSLKFTTVTSNTILSTVSSLFTFLMSLKFLDEKFTWLKLWSVLFCMVGTIIVSLADSRSTDKIARAPVWGDVLCLVSALFYAAYTTLIRKFLPDEAKGEESASTALFFGYLGLFNALLLLPVALILHFSGVEPFHKLSATQFGLITGKGIFDNVLSDLLWAKAVLLTTTTAATAGLAIQVPIAALVDALRGERPHVFDVVGGFLVLVGFCGINQPITGCCGSSIEEDSVLDGNAGNTSSSIKQATSLENSDGT